MVKLVVTCKERTKIVITDLTFENMRDSIIRKFDINTNAAIVIKYLDCEVDEYIDLEEDNVSELSGKEFLKVKVSTAVSMSNSVSTVLSSSLSTTVSNSVSTTMSTPSAAVPQQPTSPEDIEHLTACSPQNKTTPWPKQYTLPRTTIPLHVWTKMERKEALSKRDRRDLLTGIYQHACMHTGGLYPTPDRYNQLVDSILKEFPYLPSSEGLQLTSASALWKERLIYKFGNERKKEQMLPEVSARKRPKKEEIQSPRLQAVSTWGLSNYLPEELLTEDEETINQHIEWMKKEYRKKEGQNLLQVKQKMALTFPHRRKMIVTNMASAESVLVEFPFLQTKEGLIDEFLRLGPKMESPSDVEKVFMSNLDKLREKILNLTRPRKVPAVVLQIRSSLLGLRSSEERKYAVSCEAMLSLPTLVKEKIEKILCSESESSSEMVIFQRDDILSRSPAAFEVAIEGVRICTVNTLLDAFLSLLLAIYCLNLAYPKDLNKFFLFMQRILLNIHDELSSDKKLLSLMAQLNSA